MNIQKTTVRESVVSGVPGRLLFRGLVAFAVSAGAVAGSLAQEFPTRPIRVVTAAAAGSNDFAARIIARDLAAVFNSPVIVDNRSGRYVGGQIVSGAAPDGHTLLFSGTTLWVGPLLTTNAPYDAIRDFAPITLATSSPNVLVVNPALPAANVQELIALAKAKPGALNYGSGSTGASAHLAGELFKSMAGIDVVRVPYKGGGASLAALASGEVQLSFPAAGSSMPHVRAGRLRALAVTSARPSILAPGLPTVAASGLAGFESVSIVAMFAPANTPARITQRLQQEIVAALGKRDIREQLFRSGMEAVGSSPAELATVIRDEVAKYGKLIREVGIRAD